MLKHETGYLSFALFTMALIVILLVASSFMLESVAEVYYRADCNDRPPETTPGETTPDTPTVDTVRNSMSTSSSSSSCNFIYLCIDQSW
jgi:hypothetical protein